MYWMETEVHVYCFSIAANVLLSFFPFLVVMMSLFKHILHWDAAQAAVFTVLADYFPDNIIGIVHTRLQNVRRLELISILLLLFTANGVFEPMEVALNRAWGITTNRSFLKNQLVSLALIFACGALALISTSATAMNTQLLQSIGIQNETVQTFVTAALLKMAAVPLVMFAIYLIYRFLPNGKVSRERIVAAAIFVGLLLELLKYIEILIWPWFHAKLRREIGPFSDSATIIFFSFFASMLVLAGAEWASRPDRIRNPPA